MARKKLFKIKLPYLIAAGLALFSLLLFLSSFGVETIICYDDDMSVVSKDVYVASLLFPSAKDNITAESKKRKSNRLSVSFIYFFGTKATLATFNSPNKEFDNTKPPRF